MNTEDRDNVEYVPQGRLRDLSRACPRRVRVKGMAGLDATVIVTAMQDTVWLSISPPFTWEAIMKPGKVDEVISMLELARDEATKTAAARDGRVSHGGEAFVRAIAHDGSAPR